MKRREWIKSAALIGGSLSMSSALRGMPTAAPLGTALPSDSSHGYVNLSINENQWGPSPKAREAMVKAVSYAYEYPAVPHRKLREEIAVHEGVDPSQVLIGAGSSDLLKASSYVYGLQGGSLVAAEPTFNDLLRWAEPNGTEVIRIPWNDEFSPDLNKISSSLRSDTRLVYVCNPENPAGTLCDTSELKDFCMETAKSCPVFVDEAYIDFAGEADKLTMMGLVREGLPIIVSRTFSKAHGLGGMRVGYAVTTPEIAEKLKLAYVHGVVCGASHVSIEGARVAYADRQWLTHVRTETAKVRADFEGFLDNIGQPFIPSYTTFVLMPVNTDSKVIADTLFNMTKVRISPRLIHGQNYLRISLGSPAQMRKLKSGLELVLAAT
ncbi:histidinol-phosphate transaminase [Pelagicoccus sp. SDUM812002]|uniref:pyridoxal phosphate-dependent aminotransferase n=1 Tax=Pelagicoccus sp. SDUM812002 TaxID=3041266 RepID=UPI0028102CF8|nr:histidinol-phosphate transaminase [Pelagicoccus sp. SDUM812002]MDQ8186042.1 histidinol-phosphate transaminase [Pelagicoccus sp. SDUM812002]